MCIKSFTNIIILQDWACRLCDFITLNVNEIISHLLLVHDVDTYRVNRLNLSGISKNTKTQINLEDIILSKLKFIILIDLYFVILMLIFFRYI